MWTISLLSSPLWINWLVLSNFTFPKSVLSYIVRLRVDLNLKKKIQILFLLHIKFIKLFKNCFSWLTMLILSKSCCQYIEHYKFFGYNIHPTIQCTNYSVILTINLYLTWDKLLWNVEFMSVTHCKIFWYDILLQSNKL